MTIRGEGFSSVLADNDVRFNGVSATVTSASATELQVTPSVAVESETVAMLSVKTGNQTSNALAFRLVPSGHAEPLSIVLPSRPTAVVALETSGDLFVAAGDLGPQAGLYRVGSDGWVSRVWAAPVVTRAEQELAGTSLGFDFYDAPYAVTTDGNDVYFATMLGVLWQYDVATGDVSQLYRLLDPDYTNIPRVPGLAVDSSGNLFFVVASSDEVRMLTPDGAMEQVASGRSYSALLSAGSMLYVTVRQPDASVDVIENAAGPVRNLVQGWGTDVANPTAIALVGNDIVVSDSGGSLHSVLAYQSSDPGGGSFVPWGDPAGYVYGVDGLWGTSTGDLYLAMTESSAVKRIPDGSNVPEMVAAGIRVHFGTARLDDRWYLSSIGQGLFGRGLDELPVGDGAILEIAADGRSRVLLETSFPAGIIAGGPDELYFSDCFDGTIARLTPSTAATVDLLTAADGLLCPAGLYLHASGDLYYANVDASPPEPPPPDPDPRVTSIGRRLSDGTHEPDLVTGLPALSTFLNGAGDRLFSTPLATDPNQTTGLRVIDLDGTPEAELLTPGARLVGMLAIGLSPNGYLYGYRIPAGEIIEIDPLTGEVAVLAERTMQGFFNRYQENGFASAAFSLGFEPDGTIVLADYGQLSMIAVAP